MLSTKVAKVMSSVENIRSVNIDDSLQEVVEVFITENEADGRSKIFSVSKEDTLVGIITIEDVLKAAKKLMRMYSAKEMKTIGSMKAYGQKEFVIDLEKQMRAGTDLKVRDLIALKNSSVMKNDTISNAFDIMLKNRLRALAVFDEDNTIVGIIRDVDLLACIADFING